ncbi:hypothetical protein ACFLY6_02625 [Candidatus Dependentiae bacterium]
MNFFSRVSFGVLVFCTFFQCSPKKKKKEERSTAKIAVEAAEAVKETAEFAAVLAKEIEKIHQISKKEWSKAAVATGKHIPRVAYNEFKKALKDSVVQLLAIADENPSAARVGQAMYDLRQVLKKAESTLGKFVKKQDWPVALKDVAGKQSMIAKKMPKMSLPPKMKAAKLAVHKMKPAKKAASVKREVNLAAALKARRMPQKSLAMGGPPPVKAPSRSLPRMPALKPGLAAAPLSKIGP